MGHGKLLPFFISRWKQLEREINVVVVTLVEPGKFENIQELQSTGPEKGREKFSRRRVRK